MSVKRILWHRWFAWYPVRLWAGNWTWLRTVEWAVADWSHRSEGDERYWYREVSR